MRAAHRPAPGTLTGLLARPVAAAGLASMFVACLLLAGCGQEQAVKPANAAASPAVMNSPAPAAAVGAVTITSKPWTFESTPGEVFYSPSYRIYTTTTRPLLRDRMPRFMEHAMAHYRSALGSLPPPEAQLETYLMANRPQWTRVTQMVMGQDAEIYLRIQRGGFSSGGRAVLYDIGPHDTFAIAAHEGWHQYTQRAFRNTLPVWLEEGLATYMEGFRWSAEDAEVPQFMPWANQERYDQLRIATRYNRLFMLEELIQTSPQELMARSQWRALTYYAQLWALIHFLNEGEQGRYREGLRELLDDAAAGRITRKIRERGGDRAVVAYNLRRQTAELLPAYFGRTALEMEDEYQSFIAQIVRVGGKSEIVAGRSPIVRTE